MKTLWAKMVYLDMKKIYLLLALLTSGVFSHAQGDKDSKQILDLLEAQRQAWNRGSLEEFMHGYWESDSLMYIGSKGINYGYQQALNSYKKNYGDTARMGKLTFDIIKVKKLSPEYYWVLGKWSLKRSVGDAGGHFTLLFQKIKGQWVVIADHSS